MKKRMSEQSCSGNSAEERSVDWFQPVLIGAVFHEVLKHFVSSLNQFSAMVGIPRHVDQHSELMSITIPKSWRSAFRTENDQFYSYSSER
jgi:hypothetical protein